LELAAERAQPAYGIADCTAAPSVLPRPATNNVPAIVLAGAWSASLTMGTIADAKPTTDSPASQALSVIESDEQEPPSAGIIIMQL
jgi:hypothetical protein